MNWEFIGKYLPLYERAAVLTVKIGLIGIAFAILVGLLCAAIQYYKVPVARQIVAVYVEISRNTPLLVQLFIVYWGICNPLGIDKWIASVVAFSLNVGAYSAETIRAAILSIPKGQWEAGYSIGMSYHQIFTRIIIPQAAKVSVPPLFNSFISLVKDTSLASTIMITEMFRKAQEFASGTFEYLIIYLEVAFIYLIFCTLLNGVQKLLEKKLRVGKN